MRILGPLTLVRIFVVSLVFTFITHPGLYLAIANGYSGDYLFNLSGIQIFGLLLITLILAIFLFLFCTTSTLMLVEWSQKYLNRWIVVLVSAVLGMFLCGIALLFVPQIHYQYYRLILPDLPLQWVPLGDLSWATLQRYLLLSADATTTVHAKGTTVWVCVCACVLVAFEVSKPDAD